MELLDAIKARHSVRKYTDKPIVMAGPKGKDAEEKIGYYGEELVILAQTLGLNTCWVGLTYENEKTLLRKPSFEDPLLSHLPYPGLARSAINVHIFNHINC